VSRRDSELATAGGAPVRRLDELRRRLRQTGGRGRKLRGLAEILAPYRWRVLAMFVALVAATAAALAPAPLAKLAIDQGIRRHDTAALDRIVVVFLISAVVYGIATYAQTYLVGWVGQRALQDLRLKLFAQQLPDTITLLANSLRAGSSFLQGIELVTREGRPPISEEFTRVVREMSLGVALQPALSNLSRRVASEDLELMVTAINIQSQVGGNLATVLDSIAFTIRERIRIQGEIQTLTAMQRYSGYVITLLPVGLGFLLFLISPSYITPMFERPPEALGLPLGVIFFAVGLISMGIGYLLIRRIVDIKV